MLASVLVYQFLISVAYFWYQLLKIWIHKCMIFDVALVFTNMYFLCLDFFSDSRCFYFPKTVCCPPNYSFVFPAVPLSLPSPRTWSLPLFCTSTHATFSWSGVSVQSLRQPTACTFSPRMSIFHLLFYSLVVLHFDCSFWLLYWLHHWCCFPSERTFKYRINKTFPFC